MHSLTDLTDSVYLCFGPLLQIGVGGGENNDTQPGKSWRK